MKKIIPILAFVLVASACGVFETIALNTTYKGSRVILTTDRHLFGNINMALGFKIEKADTIMAILITSTEDSNHGIFDMGDKLQFRTRKGNVVELSNIYEKEFEKETNTGVTETPRTDIGYAYTYSPWCGGVYLTPYTATHMVQHAYCYTTTYSYGLYPVTRSQLETIIYEGVAKFRVETENDYLDMPSPDNVNRILNKQRNDLRATAANDRKKQKGSF